MRVWRLLRLVAAAIAVSVGLAGPGMAGPAEDELWVCMTNVLRRVPTWRAMRDARVEMQQKGFRVVSRQPENFAFHGHPVYSYGFQINGDNKVYSVQCER